MLEKELDLEGVDEICCAVEYITEANFIFDVTHAVTVSAPLK